MHIISLKDLPAPPQGKAGWPWTEVKDEHLLRYGPDHEWPKVTIVTPNLNQGHFIEETIRSVLLQNYPNLEYIVIDGGSTDNSADIIRKYERFLTYWVSEKDDGMYDAICKGFDLATGEILGWQNSSDMFLPGALNKAVDVMRQYGSRLIIGAVGLLIYGRTRYDIHNVHPLIKINPFKYMCYAYWTPPQCSCLWRRDLWEEVGGINRSLCRAGDYELFLKMTYVCRPKIIDTPLSLFQSHKGALSMTQDERGYKLYDLERNLVAKEFIQEKGISLISVVIGRMVYSVLYRLASRQLKDMFRLPTKRGIIAKFNLR